MAHFLARLHRIARLFRELGVARGDVVTVLAPSIPDIGVALWAAEAVGIAHPVNTLLRATDIDAVMRAAGLCRGGAGLCEKTRGLRQRADPVGYSGWFCVQSSRSAQGHSRRF